MNKEKFPIELLPQPVKKLLEIHKNKCEVPDEFLAVAGLAIGATLAGKWYSSGLPSLNLYVLLVGSTASRKSTAINIAQDLLKRIEKANPDLICTSTIPTTNGDKKLELKGSLKAYPMATHFSVEGVQAHMCGENVSSLLTLGEYKMVFDLCRRQAQGNTITELTTMYDCGPISVNNVNRKIEVDEYCVTLLGASTQSWLSDFNSAQNIAGGFFNRHLIVTGVPTQIIPEKLCPSETEWEEVIQLFSKIAPSNIMSKIEDSRVIWMGEKKQIQWEPAAKKGYDEYYKSQTKKHRELSLEDEQLADISAREITHAQKLAILRAVTENRSSITKDDVIFGARLARYSVRNAIEMCTPGTKKLGKIETRIIDYLGRNGTKAKHSDIVRHIGGVAEKTKTALSRLTEFGLISRSEIDNSYELTADDTNYQQSKIDKLFGKSNIYEFFIFEELGVGEFAQPKIDDSSDQNLIDFTQVPS